MRRAYEQRRALPQAHGRARPDARPTSASLDDIARLPFTVKTDLRDTYPFGLFASPMQEIVRLHASSGTTGKPIVVAYTQEDVDVWTERHGAHLRRLRRCTSGDIIQNAYGYGLFTGGLGAHYGAEALGATVIPISGGNTDRQIMVMKDFGVTAICCTPSYFLHLIDRAARAGRRPARSCRCAPASSAPSRGPSPCAGASRADSGIKAYDIYGLSEIIGPGVAIECPRQAGLHIFEDHFYPGDHRPRDRRAAARRRGGRAGPDHALASRPCR